MRTLLVFLATLATVAFAGSPVYAAVTAKFSFPVARAPHPLALDPSLSDPAWKAGLVPDGAGPWMNLTTKSPAREATTAYLLYDDHFLYVAFRAEQAPGTIVASQSTNDVGFGIDDFVGIGFSTTASGAQGYYFETTPRGIRYEQADENVRYRARWESAASVDGKGWTAVLIVPFSVLKIAGGGSQTWRLQFVRALAQRGEHIVWAYDGLMNDQPGANWPTFADTRFWAQGTLKLDGIARARPKPRADVYALGSVGQDRNLFQQANGTFLPEKARPLGADVSVPLTQTISFVGTLNPDFSNVEIDQQTIVPQEFQRQLIEYRPFFAQGANYINALSGTRSPSGGINNAPNLVFYSPSVGPFDSGAKVEGTYGKQSFGALTFHGYDETTGTQFDDEAYGYLHALPDGTFQYWSDGVIANHGALGNDATFDQGVEGRNLASGLVWYAEHAFENGSWVPQGHADQTELFADIHKPNFEVLGSYLDIAPNYNPIDGYTVNSDIRGPQGFVNLVGSLPGVKSWSLYSGFDRFLDESGAVHQADADFFLNATFKNGFSIDGMGPSVGELRSYGVPAGPGCSGPIVATSSFTGYPCYRDGVTQPFDLMQIPLGYGDGTPAPVDVSYSWGPFGSNDVHLFTTSTSRPIGRRLSISLAYDGTYERPLTGGPLDSQWLRSVALGYNLSSESTLSVALRDINGYGGFATQIGNNLAVAYHRRFRTGDELYVNFGSPAAGATLDRLIVKFVFHAGADEGT